MFKRRGMILRPRRQHCVSIASLPRTLCCLPPPRQTSSRRFRDSNRLFINMMRSQNTVRDSSCILTFSKSPMSMLIIGLISASISDFDFPSTVLIVSASIGVSILLSSALASVHNLTRSLAV
ncbi:hypothetical protein F5883DRAFT_251551 [Diaporthe sp. PMI_573]|nr:hypothetical protein F5883DRAFT_251551 [Diaporthaceae sp. PMI_573]